MKHWWLTVKQAAKKRIPFTKKEEDSRGKMKKRHRQKHRESASETEKKNRKMAGRSQV